jgi:hypothetical protein
MAVLSKTEIASLSTEERLALIDDIWESLESQQVANESTALPVADWQHRILDERLLDLEKFPENDVSLTEARNRSLL